MACGDALPGYRSTLVASDAAVVDILKAVGVDHVPPSMILRVLKVRKSLREVSPPQIEGDDHNLKTLLLQEQAEQEAVGQDSFQDSFTQETQQKIDVRKEILFGNLKRLLRTVVDTCQEAKAIIAFDNPIFENQARD